MNGWKEYRLGEVLTFQRGHDLTRVEMQKGLHPVAGSNGIIGYHDKYTTKGPGVTIGRSGNIGTPHYYSSDFWAHNTVLFVKEFMLMIPKFVYYFLKTIDFNQLNAGSSVPTLNRNHIHEINVLIPPLPEQTAIAEVLSSLDDKIDLLHRQNKTLEQLAETLFRQWFVEENKGSYTLRDYVDSANTGLDAIRRAPIVEQETGIKCLRIQDVSQSKALERWGNSKVKENDFRKFQLKRDDIIMARTCSPGINLFVREDLPAVFNNGLVRIRAKRDKVHSILLNYLFKTRDFTGYIDGISGGTSVQLNMKVGDLLSYDFSFPAIEKQNENIEQFMSFDQKMNSNQKQIRTLTQLRDTLLPKLMSGELRVEEN